MKSLTFCLLFLFCVSAVLRMAFQDKFCRDLNDVVFIINKEATDHTAFSAQQIFIQGLTERLTNENTNLSLVVFERQIDKKRKRKIKRKFVFLVTFLSVPKFKFKLDMLYERPRQKKRVQRVADFFQVKLYNDLVLVVGIDVDLPLSFYLKRFYNFGGDVYSNYDIYRKYYEIFTHGLQDIQFKSRYYRVVSRDSKYAFQTQQTNKIWSKDTCMFQYHYEMIYDNICATNSVTGSAIKPYWNLFERKDCYGFICDIEVDYGEDVKVTLISLDTRWLLVQGNDTSNTCSKYGMSPPTIRNKKEANRIGKVLREDMIHFRLLHNVFHGSLVLRFGLVKRQNTVGRRFAWSNGKDLSYSLWADGEPKGSDKFGCAEWKLDMSNVPDSRWLSVRCSKKWNKSILFCHDEPSQIKHAKLNIMQENATFRFRNAQPKNYGEIYYEDNQEKIITTSMSLVIASGFIHKKLQESYNLILKGYVHNEHVTIPSGQSESFISELDNLFHSCDDASSSQGVPYSQVCDGIKDCNSGSDEVDCAMSGYPSCSNREFSCTSGQCVPLYTKCDLIQDCHDGSDEVKCDRDCQHRSCLNGRCLPRSWFHDGQVDCSDDSDELESESKPCVLICNRTQCVTRDMLNDGVLDCKGPEGPIDETLGSLESFDCSKKGNRSFINKWAPKCVLFHDIFREIIGCRDFSHLEKCEDFVCPPNYAKCPTSFCIPIAYLNDGREDCDYGEDESPQGLENSVDLFKCHPERSQYIPMTSVCDGRNDCFNGEDEFDCEWTCSPGFICLAGAISATRRREVQALSDWSFISPKTRYVDISGMQVPDFFKKYPTTHFNHLLYLNLSRCGIDDIRLGTIKTKSGSEDFQAIRTLDLSHNKIVTLGGSSIFSILYHLETLDLSHNERLAEIGSFFHMKNLKHIDLSFTGINHLQQNAFLPLRGLKTLSLKQTRVTVINFILPASLNYFNIEKTNILSVAKNIFTKTRASSIQIHSSSFKVCCPQVLSQSIRRHLCHSPANEVIFSCEDLVEEWLLRAMIWLVGLATLAGNIITLVYRLTWDRKLLNKPYGLFVTNLGVSDTLMGCYLVTIAVADLKFQGEYVLHDYGWRTSAACWAAGTMATLSSIASTLFVSLITVERFLVVRFPYGEIRFSKQTVTAAVLGTWILGVLLATLPLLPFAENWVIYSSNAMCLGLPLRRERLPGWQYTVFLFVGLNFGLFLLIGAGQVAIFMNVRSKKRQTTKNLNRHSQLFQNQRREEIAIAKKLALVVISNSICWFPIITLGLMTLCGVDVGAAAYRWSAVVVLPVNSALNPLLYTLPALKEKIKELNEARRLAKAAANTARKTKETPAYCLQRSWRSKIRMVKRLRQSLNNKDVYRNCTLAELETVYKKVIDVRAAW